LLNINKMPKAGQLLFLNLVLIIISLSLIVPNLYSQNSNFKVSEFKINQKPEIAPGDIIASCVVEEGGDIPYKRYALVYTDFENNNIKMLLEKTVVQWGGWSWSEVSWFSPITERKSCRVSSVVSECTVTLASQAEVKLKLIDNSGNIRVEKLATSSRR